MTSNHSAMYTFYIDHKGIMGALDHQGIMGALTSNIDPYQK